MITNHIIKYQTTRINVINSQHQKDVFHFSKQFRRLWINIGSSRLIVIISSVWNWFLAVKRDCSSPDLDVYPWTLSNMKIVAIDYLKYVCVLLMYLNQSESNRGVPSLSPIVCSDNTDYVSHLGLRCVQHISADCKEWIHVGYEYGELERNCPYTCKMWWVSILTRRIYFVWSILTVIYGTL